MLALVIAGGVLWSNVDQYHDVWLAPRGQLHELETIGHEFAGDGPALMTNYEPYGVRHFLRGLDPEGASELRRRFDYLVDGDDARARAPPPTSTASASTRCSVYRTLVLRRGPAASRPPSGYRLVWSGRYYEVWQRPVAPGQDDRSQHLPLGDASQAAGGAVLRDALQGRCAARSWSRRPGRRRSASAHRPLRRTQPCG